MQRDISDSIPEIALDWHRQGKGAALATVVETWGSAPRQAGSQLAISGTGEIMGSVSGGPRRTPGHRAGGHPVRLVAPSAVARR